MSEKKKTGLSKLQIKHELWRRGELTWKFHIIQREMWEIFKKAEPRSVMVWLLSRQTGKSYFMAILACIQANTKPYSIIKLLTDTKLHAKTIYEPIFREILDDCPEELKPEYTPSSFIYTFPNGSQIQLAGAAAGHAEKLRGQKADLILIDEAGFCDNLESIVKSILLPTTTHTGGMVVMASTPPELPDHDFHMFIEQAELNETLVKKTIYDNPLLEQDTVDNIIKQMGGVNDPRFRREYLCEIIRDGSNTCFPEFDEDKEKEIIKDVDRPPFFDTYVGMDLGFNDYTATLFGYYDFRTDTVVIEDEIMVDGQKMILPEFSQEILDKESELWTNSLTHEKKEPYVRSSDINPLVTQEMSRSTDYKLVWKNADKKSTNGDFKGAAVNNIRARMKTGRLIISPKCVNLIRHLRNCRWKDAHTKLNFARSAEDGHYDTVDALIYLIGGIVESHNPYPVGYDLRVDLSKPYHIVNTEIQHKSSSDSVEVLKKIFSKKK